MRVASPIAALVFAAVLAGCGADDEPPSRQPERVRLQITAPVDGTTVRERTSDVRGRVSPRSADVEVLGRPALVSDGRFTVVVPLEPGVNVIDVIATAPRRSPALTALRVTRDALVSVPRLAGVPQGELEQRLECAGPSARRRSWRRLAGFPVLRRTDRLRPAAGGRNARAARQHRARRRRQTLLSSASPVG